MCKHNRVLTQSCGSSLWHTPPPPSLSPPQQYDTCWRHHKNRDKRKHCKRNAHLVNTALKDKRVKIKAKDNPFITLKNKWEETLGKYLTLPVRNHTFKFRELYLQCKNASMRLACIMSIFTECVRFNTLSRWQAVHKAWRHLVHGVNRFSSWEPTKYPNLPNFFFK